MCRNKIAICIWMKNWLLSYKRSIEYVWIQIQGLFDLFLVGNIRENILWIIIYDSKRSEFAKNECEIERYVNVGKHIREYTDILIHF